MQGKDAPVLEQTQEEFKAHILTTISAEQRLKGLSAEQIARAIADALDDQERQLLEQADSPPLEQNPTRRE